MKFFFTGLLLFISTLFYAQEITYNGAKYAVKGKEIFQNKDNVTATLSEAEKAYIFAAFKIEETAIKEQLEQEKKLKELEKKQKKAAKKLKKAEKLLKKRTLAEKNLKKTQKRLDKETKRHQRLLKKGKLSSESNLKHQNKLKSLKNKVTKAAKKLQKL